MVNKKGGAVGAACLQQEACGCGQGACDVSAGVGAAPGCRAGDELCDAYRELRAFADGARGTGLVVSPRSLSVPRTLRPEFYALVEKVQRACARQVLGADGLGRLAATARMCAASRDALTAGANLALYKLPDMLERLVADPEAAAAEPAFGMVLDALQADLGSDGGCAGGRGEAGDTGFSAAGTFGVADADRAADALLARAAEGLPGACALLERCAYETWAYLGVVAALDPVRFWGVGSCDTVEVHPYETDALEVGAQVTSPERRMPESVFQTRDGRVFGMRVEAARELDFYGVKIVRRRDHSAAGNTANLMGHRALLLYGLRSVDAVGIVADREKNVVVPPDLICEVLAPSDMATPAHVSAFVARVNALRSRRPVQVLTCGEDGSFPDGMLDDPGVAAVERTVVACDPARLAAVAARLG